MPLDALLAICPNFPSPGSASDGQAVYLHHAVQAIHRASGARVVVAALRIAGQAAEERCAWGEIHRAEPPEPLPSVFQAYEPGRFPQALAPLAPLARRLAVALRAEGRHPAAWCHGYETAETLETLQGEGLPTVAVVHYSIAQESLHDLGLADDRVRREAVGGLLPRLLSTAVPPALRPAFVRLSSRAAGVGDVLPLHRVLALQLSKLAMERRLLEGADQIVAVGRSFAASLGRLYPRLRPKISWCFAGALPAPARAPREPNGRLELLMVGRPSLQKGWDYAAEALHLIERDSPRLADRLAMTAVGGLGAWEGPASVYAERVTAGFRRLRRVRFADAGHLAPAEVEARYKAADVLLHPAVFEPFGLVIVEALGHGCLVVASDTDGPRDLLRPPFGWRVPFAAPRRRAANLAAALERVARLSPEERARGQAAAREACAELGWEGCAAGHLRALEAASLRTLGETA